MQTIEFKCFDCPRRCGVLKTAGEPCGFCATSALPSLARAAAHFGEEPCITGTRGSGTLFFTGCNLRCVFCQNHEISRGKGGKQVSIPELRDIMLRLQDEGVHNINLVTPSHHVRPIAEALSGIKLDIPVVWNSSGYDSVESLKMLEGLVQVYMPDFKYAMAEPAKLYSAAEDDPQVAKAAIKEMYRQRGPIVMDEDGLLKSGLLIRHLILPQQELNTMEVIDFVADEFPKDSVLFSLMSQYTPMPGLEAFPELQQRVSAATNSKLIAYMQRVGIELGYWQDGDSATDEMIPDFDNTGL